MNKRILAEDEVQDFVDQLYSEKRWAISVEREADTDNYVIKWIEHKTYVSYTGETYPDEVWRTEDGSIMCVQDMEPEHARNALRMILRRQRIVQDALLEQLANTIEEGNDPAFDIGDEALFDEEGQFQDLLNESPFYHGKKPTLQ